tara:strand:+ start:245 stop:565 length:321 start_codon:yes stop_codon:yes gene_type:complete
MMIESSYIRMQLGTESLKTLRHEYKVLELVNSLYDYVSSMENCDYEISFTTDELTMLGSQLGDLIRLVSDDYGMVCAKDKHNPKYKSHFRTFKGEHDEWKEISDET